MEQAPTLTERPRWWHSRRKRWRFLAHVFLLIGLLAFIILRIDLFLLGSFGAVGLLLVDWLWFRFFDPAYPNDDIERSPDDLLDGHGAGFDGALFFVALVSTGLFLWIVFDALVKR